MEKGGVMRLLFLTYYALLEMFSNPIRSRHEVARGFFVFPITREHVMDPDGYERSAKQKASGKDLQKVKAQIKAAFHVESFRARVQKLVMEILLVAEVEGRVIWVSDEAHPLTRADLSAFLSRNGHPITFADPTRPILEQTEEIERAIKAAGLDIELLY